MRLVLDKNPVILAPMTGILNLPLRLTFRRFGWGIACIGSIDAEMVAKAGNGMLINILGKEEHTNSEDRPLILQLMGKDADALTRAMSLLEDKADIFDVNLGCPLKAATSKGQGAALLQKPEWTLKFLEKVVQTARRPLMVKIRLLSQNDNRKTVWFARRLEEIGISGLVVHARTPSQGFTGNADWDTIRAVKEQLTIPVLGNGGLRTVNDIITCQKYTGCDGVVIGSGVMRDPFLAADYRQYLASDTMSPTRTFGDLLGFAREYASVACSFNSSSSGLYYLWTVLQFFLLRSRTKLFVLRHSR